MKYEQVLIDNIYYNIIDEITYKDTTYVYLQNDETEDLLIQKVNNDNLVNLDNDEEINKALLVFSDKKLKDV